MCCSWRNPWLVHVFISLPYNQPHDLLPKDTHHWGRLDQSPEIIVATPSSGQSKRQRRSWKSSGFLPDISIRGSLGQKELQTSHLPLRHHSLHGGFLAFLSYGWWQPKSFEDWLLCALIFPPYPRATSLGDSRFLLFATILWEDYIILLPVLTF